jgi:uncharacterized protein (DUF2126 family)
MTIRVAIHHKTRYQYDRHVTLLPHILRLRPAVHSRTPIRAYSLKVQPADHFINWQQDPFGNFLARLVFTEPARELAIDVEVVADMTVINPFDFFLDEEGDHYPFTYAPAQRKELAPYLEVEPPGPLMRRYLETVNLTRRRSVDFLVDLNHELCEALTYTIRLEPGVQTCEETLEKRSGSCRDSGWLLVNMLRHLGLAARFVSGYLVQLTADVKSLDGPSGPAQDFTDLHAWAEVYVPGAGWLGLDPTSGLFAGEGHIPLACAPHPSSAAPITGLIETTCEVNFEYENRVVRIHEDPRVTKPFSNEQWGLINALGHQVDDLLKQQDVRLTMGGEPTFVSIDDMDAPEWTTAALGEHKRKLAGDLARRLRESFSPGGVLHFGQGKWYPGEPLPRWRLSCIWRPDGEPVWPDTAWLADETRDYGHGIPEAERFMRTLAKQLGIDTQRVIPGFEDAFYYAWREENLPQDVDPLKANLKDSLERRRLARLLDSGLNQPTGYVLPLAWEDDGWSGTVWPVRRGRLFLVPGDSPMGYRLPLDSLSRLDKEREALTYERDLFQDLPKLAPAPKKGATPSPAPDRPTAKEMSRTALCVEPREGRLNIFLPPQVELEQWLALLAHVDAVARAENLPVILEGYPPPHDPRICQIDVTPDPGVIEVNIHPSASWDELASRTEELYEQARLSRLGTEKFMLDGRHTGTGGGNHVTIGGPTPSDSPILRNPGLLRSLITYWQHHPGLSYLFSGLFIGPTSQAPRVDEARDEIIHELETAFQQLPEGHTDAPWLVDRVLRNLLVDITGNTHRAEFCIDKLYSPDGPSGRLGLVELRAFEMPPHYRMSLVQALLLRSLISWFWNTPYHKPLVRWGTELHDRFMLPHYVMADLRDVCRDLHQAGIPFQTEWLAPFLEFRFPHYGEIAVDDLTLELRMALEPWNVLGEEVRGTGTTRFVDSSVERVQVQIDGMTGNRHVVTCNGRRLPLRSTGTQGSYAAGVRYRAWQPASALHPTIGVHVPLVFDVIDTWSGRAIGGCTYHVAHPGGRHYEDFPVNAFEAESRRIARFWSHGHTPGPLELPPLWKKLAPHRTTADAGQPLSPPSELPDPEYPYTLDLRRKPEWIL